MPDSILMIPGNQNPLIMAGSDKISEAELSDGYMFASSASASAVMAFKKGSQLVKNFNSILSGIDEAARNEMYEAASTRMPKK
jgi:hypothetical protein